MTTREQIEGILKTRSVWYPHQYEQLADKILSLISTHYIPRERVEEEIEVWCSCGDLMEHEPSDKFDGTVYGKAFYCLGCGETIYFKSHRALLEDNKE